MNELTGELTEETGRLLNKLKEQASEDFEAKDVYILALEQTIVQLNKKVQKWTNLLNCISEIGKEVK